MKLLSTLTAFTLAAAAAPALIMSSPALSEDRSNPRSSVEQGSGEHFMSHKPGSAIYASDVIGATVKHQQSGDDVGEIQDLVVGSNGRVMAAVIATGGFMGLGGQEVSLSWKHLNHVREDEVSVFYVNIDEETLKNAPEHERE